MTPSAAFLALALAAGLANPHPTVGTLLDCLDGKVALISAHRGGPDAGYPENALETMARTAGAAPVILEIDVRRTRDGVLMLMHDEALERTSTGRGRIRDHTWAEIAPLRLKDPAGRVTGFSPARLDAALEWARGRTLLQLDVKEMDALPAILQAVRQARAQPYVTLVLYTAADAVEAARLDPSLTLHATVPDARALEALQRAGVSPDRIHAWTGTGPAQPALWRRLDRRGVPVVYGVLGARERAIAMAGSDEPYRTLEQQGVDILASDRPLAAFRAIDRGGRTRRALAACGVR